MYNLLRPFFAFFALSTIAIAHPLPTFDHVFIVMEENANYSDVIGSQSMMPYLESLATSYGLATQYYANTHPSIGNYFMLTTGQIITNDDNYQGTVTADNVVRELLAAGRTWKAYEESLPHAGYTTPDTGEYARRHCPLSYLSDVVNDSTQKLNLVPFTQFATDLKNNDLPDYAFITPNLCNDAHDCPLATADAWLQDNIEPLIKSKAFRKGGLLVITFDESETDDTHGGGQVAWVAISPKFSKPGYQSTKLYQHQNTLRLMMQGIGLTVFPGQAKSATDMGEFFRK